MTAVRLSPAVMFFIPPIKGLHPNSIGPLSYSPTTEDGPSMDWYGPSLGAAFALETDTKADWTKRQCSTWWKRGFGSRRIKCDVF